MSVGIPRVKHNNINKWELQEKIKEKASNDEGVRK